MVRRVARRPAGRGSRRGRGLNVFDASALLAFLQGEAGADVVEDVLPGGVCSAVNWSEVAQRIRAHGRNWDLARALLRSYEVVVEPTTEGDAERAASRWQGGEGLSLADRLCLATGERLDAVVWTADRGWGESEHVRQVR